jgi:hypothetical protein
MDEFKEAVRVVAPCCLALFIFTAMTVSLWMDVTFSRNVLLRFVYSAWRLARILMRSNQINDLCVLTTQLLKHVNNRSECGDVTFSRN